MRVYEKRGKFWFVPKNPEMFGEKKWICLGADYHEMLLKHRELTAPRAGTLDDVWRRYKANVLPDNATITQSDKTAYWNVLQPVFGHCMPDDIFPPDIYDYLDARREGGARVTGNREIALLSHMYTKAIRWRMAKMNPCLRVERNKENTREKIYVTDKMLSDWLNFAPRKLALYTELSYLLGQRCSDVLKLMHSQFKGDTFEMKAGKTKKKSVYPITQDMRDLLAEMKTVMLNRKGVQLVTDYVICTRYGKRYTKSGFDSVWKVAMEKFVAAGFKRFTPSDMRAKHASDLDAAGGDARRNLQHSNQSVTDRHYLRKPAVLTSLKRLKY